MHPNFTAVTSSVIYDYLYVAERKLLLIAFKSGAVYGYENVEQGVATGLANASSKGTFFGSAIRNRYASTKLDELALANIMDGLNATAQPRAIRNVNVTLHSLLQRYPILGAVF